jgi:nitrogen fixation NifU-like protein
MSELEDLYQEVILDHNKAPRNFGVLEDADRKADGHNPLCGDRLHLTLKTDGEALEALKFTGDGCAISKASASLMTERLAGLSVAEARTLAGAFHALVTGEDESRLEGVQLGKLAALGGVQRFPVRVKCAMLAWRTLEAALDQAPEPTSTE